MDLQPTLENELIILRPLKESDFEQLFKVAKDPLIWEQHPNYDRYKKHVYSEFFQDSIESKGALIVIDKSNNKIIGSTRFKPIKHNKNAVEIGWSFLSRHYWGGTYNKSMKVLMIDYAFKFVENIIFYIGKNNMRSQKAVQKIGGTIISGITYRHLIKNSGRDLTFRINKSDWVNRKT